MSAYGDSETESDDDDEDDVEGLLEDDLENLDSVSVVAARQNASVLRPSVPHARVPGHAHHSHDADSGRGESPESQKGGVVLIRPHRGSGKAPRPISAVPSEYSDISTSSCRSNVSTEEDIKAVNNEGNATVVVEVEEEEDGDDEEVCEDRETRMAKAYRIVCELLSTEEQYVSVLHLIDQVRLLFLNFDPNILGAQKMIVMWTEKEV